MAGIKDTVFSWFKSYLTDRNSFINDESNSETHTVTCGIPQRSMLGPAVFKFCMLPLRNVISRHEIDFHSYSRLMILNSMCLQIEKNFFNALLMWKIGWQLIFLKLNKANQKHWSLGQKLTDKKPPANFKTLVLIWVAWVNLEVFFDADLNFKNYISSTIKTAFFHLKQLS